MMPSNTAAIPRISVTMVSFATDGAGADKFKVEQNRYTPSQKPIPPKIDTTLALTPKSMTVWYDDSESSSSSSEDEESEEDNEHEGDDDTRQQQVLRRRREQQQEPYRAMHLTTPPPTLAAIPGLDRHSPRYPHSSRNQSPLSPKVMINDNITVPSNAPVPRSPFSPLRHSFTAFTSFPSVDDEKEKHQEEEEEEESPASGNIAGSSPSSSVLPEDKKGLDKGRFEGLLRSSRERRAGMNMRIQTTGLSSPPPPQQRVTSPVHVTPVASSARKTMDLRKEITLKAHVAKHGTLYFFIHVSLVRRIDFVRLVCS